MSHADFYSGLPGDPISAHIDGECSPEDPLPAGMDGQVRFEAAMWPRQANYKIYRVEFTLGHPTITEVWISTSNFKTG